MGALIDLSGKRFGRCTVVRRVPTAGRVLWECLCDCGGVSEVDSQNLRSGHTTSCGCGRVTHRRSGHPLYDTWQHMWQRCTDPTCPDYPIYGGRGITVCRRWGDIECFLQDMGPRPLGGTLERRDNNMGYTPGNCVWASRADQNRNRRTNRLTRELAEHIAVMPGGQKSIAEHFGVSQATVSRVKNGKQWNY